MTAGFNRSASISAYLLILATVLAFCFDFAHGISLRQDSIGFHPIYRLRQAVAVAISRMHEPTLHGYLAYQSVVDALTENGFAIAHEDKGPHLDPAGWSALLGDPARMDHALRAAYNTSIDTTLEPQLVSGNELGYADYVYLAFRLFGLHMSSQYYLYFLLLGVSCILFLIEFRRSPFLLFLLLTYLAGLGFLQNYAQSMGNEAATLANSRLFEALSLLPAMHLFLLAWRRAPFRPETVIGAAIQSGLLAFIVDCRITARWQVAMIVAAAFVVVVAAIWKRRPLRPLWRRDDWSGVWVACLAAAALAAHMTFIHYDADARYGKEPRYHIVWHEVLRGLLGGSTVLQREYIGRVIGIRTLQDTDAYDAVFNDINKRNDHSAATSFMQNGRIWIDVSKGWGDYERLARNLSIRMAIEHPGEVLLGFYYKCLEQARTYTYRNAMVPANLAIPALIAALGALLWLVTGGMATTTRAILDGAGAMITVLACAAVPPLVVSSFLSVGTLLAYLVALVVALAAAAMLAVRAARHARALVTHAHNDHPMPRAGETRP